MDSEKENKVIDNNICDGSIEGCNGGDEFVTAPCPVHSKIEKEKLDGIALVVTDIDFSCRDQFENKDKLTKQDQSVFVGFLFNCPSCKAPSIMVNPTGFRFCPACGRKVIVKSAMLTTFIRKKGVK
ncbi:MAG: hypothetical protein V3W20_10655 [Candidatus Neomarinimicrobiota bacterium]